MKFVFKTKRMNVFMDVRKYTDHNTKRMLFIGMRTDIDCPRVAVNAMVNFQVPHVMPYYMDWIETSESHRRIGLAEELWAGIEKHLGDEVAGDGASDAGHGLCVKLERGE